MAITRLGKEWSRTRWLSFLLFSVRSHTICRQPPVQLFAGDCRPVQIGDLSLVDLQAGEGPVVVKWREVRMDCRSHRSSPADLDAVEVAPHHCRQRGVRRLARLLCTWTFEAPRCRHLNGRFERFHDCIGAIRPSAWGRLRRFAKGANRGQKPPFGTSGASHRMRSWAGAFSYVRA